MTIVRMIVAGAFLLAGVAVFVIGTIGFFKFDYVLNRMHASAMGDSMGLPLVCIGAALLFWNAFPAAKLLLIVVFMYLTSPVSAHLIARVEMLTNRNLARYVSPAEEAEEDEEEA